MVIALSLPFGLFFHSCDRKEPAHASTAPNAALLKGNSLQQSAGRMLAGYNKLKEGFVRTDTTGLASSAIELKQLLDSFDSQDLEKDSLLYEKALDPLESAISELESIAIDPSMEEKRGSLNILSHDLRDLLNLVRYDQRIVYWLENPRAFPNHHPGYWLGENRDSPDPYIGLTGGTGRVVDSIDFTPKTTKKN